MSQKIAFLFPGQGSQAVGMLNDFAADEGSKAIYQTLCSTADSVLGEPLSQLIQNGPSEDLNLTVNTQPAMLLASVMCFESYLSFGGRAPDAVAGHSLGEYAAVVAAGGLSLSDAISLVRIRAQAMQNAVPVGQGGMAAILGLSDSQVLEACKTASINGELVEAVNFNAPNQVVAAGSAKGIESLCVIAKEMGAKRALPLPVSAPFHSSLLKPAAEPLQEAIAQRTLAPLKIDLVNNVDVAIEHDPAKVADALVRQAYNPVRWVETIQKMCDNGVTLFVECGPGKVLSGLVKRICDVPVTNISSPAQAKELSQQLKG